jgi:hypothetical protein
MKARQLEKSELQSIAPGEAMTLAAVLSILAISVMAIVCYRLFVSGKGSARLPGGWAFSWQ